MIIEQICKYLVSEIVREDRSASLRRVCTLLAQLEPVKGQSPTSGSSEEFGGQKASLKFLYVQNPLLCLTPSSVALLSSPRLTFKGIYSAFELNDFSTLFDTKAHPIDPHGPVLPILLVFLYIKLLKTTPEHIFHIYRTLLFAKEKLSEYTWRDRNSTVKFEALISAIMNRRLRFGDAHPSKVDLWFNEMFETGELMWIDQKRKGEAQAEAEIWGDPDSTLPYGSSGSSSASISASPTTTSSRVLSERTERQIKPLSECLERIKAFSSISDKIVLSNLQFLLLDKRALPDAVLHEANVNMLLGLVRNYVEGLHTKQASPTPSSTASSTLHTASNSFEVNSEVASILDASSGSLKGGLLGASEDRVKEAIVESVLELFSRWCKAASPRWGLPSSAYLRKPAGPVPNLVEGLSERSDATEGDFGFNTYSLSQRNTLTLKRYACSLLNGYIIRLLQSVPQNGLLTTKCFVQLAYSTIVLRPPEKDIPTQIFVHYLQFGPLSALSRSQYWEMVDAIATLMRHMTNLDNFLELSGIILNEWNIEASPFYTRPPVSINLPMEAQHLPPAPLFNQPTQLVVSHPPKPLTNLSSHHNKPPRLNMQELSPSPSETPSAHASPSLSQPGGFGSNGNGGVARKRLPSLLHQRDIFALFRQVSLWRRYDQGWSEAADDEIHALALTIQYVFLNGSRQAQVMSLMAGMGILEGLVQSKSLGSTYTLGIFNDMLTKATMSVAMNAPEIRSDWHYWRQSIATIVSNFDQSFPNIDDTLLLQIVTDVLLEDALNVDYLFNSEPTPENLAQMMRSIEVHKASYIFRLIPLFSRSLSNLFIHTKNQALHDAILFKLHSYAVRLHHMWRVYQPKYRSMNTAKASTTFNDSTETTNPPQTEQQGANRDANTAPSTTGSSSPSSTQASQSQASNQSPLPQDIIRLQMATIAHGGSVEKAAKLILEKIFSAFVFIFDHILTVLPYKGITRSIEALGFIEFCASKEIEDGSYSSLLEKQVDRFHALRPQDNWILNFLNLGIASIFGGVSNMTRDMSLKLDKPSLGRIKQYLSVIQITCSKYPHVITRTILEQQGLLMLIFWMLENPYKAINRKAHQTMVMFFLQPNLLSNEKLIVDQTGHPIAPSSAPEPLSSGSTSANTSSPSQTQPTPANKQKKSSASRKKSSSRTIPAAGALVPGSLQYIPTSFVEEIVPYYWRLTLECYPEKTKGESILIGASILLTSALPPDSPLLPYIIELLMDKLTSMRLSKSAAELTRIVLSLIAVVPHSCLPLLLSLLQEYVSQCPKRLQRFLCVTIQDSISKNSDYTRKELCTSWYLNLINSLSLHARL